MLSWYHQTFWPLNLFNNVCKCYCSTSFVWVLQVVIVKNVLQKTNHRFTILGLTFFSWSALVTNDHYKRTCWLYWSNNSVPRSDRYYDVSLATSDLLWPGHTWFTVTPFGRKKTAFTSKLLQKQTPGKQLHSSWLKRRCCFSYKSLEHTFNYRYVSSWIRASVAAKRT